MDQIDDVLLSTKVKIWSAAPSPCMYVSIDVFARMSVLTAAPETAIVGSGLGWLAFASVGQPAIVNATIATARSATT